jgi:hypothetical protein
MCALIGERWRPEGAREWVRQSAAPVATASRFKLAQPDRGAEHGEFGFGASAAGVHLWSGMTHPGPSSVLSLATDRLLLTWGDGDLCTLCLPVCLTVNPTPTATPAAYYPLADWPPFF